MFSFLSRLVLVIGASKVQTRLVAWRFIIRTHVRLVKQIERFSFAQHKSGTLNWFIPIYKFCVEHFVARLCVCSFLSHMKTLKQSVHIIKILVYKLLGRWFWQSDWVKLFRSNSVHKINNFLKRWMKRKAETKNAVVKLVSDWVELFLGWLVLYKYFVNSSRIYTRRLQF